MDAAWRLSRAKLNRGTVPFAQQSMIETLSDRYAIEREKVWRQRVSLRRVRPVMSRISVLSLSSAIKVNYDAIALGNMALRLGHCLVGGASRPEAVTVLGKRRVPTPLKDPRQGLLDQSVDIANHLAWAKDARLVEFSDPAIRPRIPHIRFLLARSRFCSTLPSDAASQ